MSTCNTANKETRTRKGPIRCRVWLEAFTLSAFFNMSCSIKHAFQRAFPSGAIYDISKYCNAFDVLSKVRKLMIIAFLKEQGLKYSIRRTRLLSALAAEYEWKAIKHSCSRRTCRAFVEVLFDEIFLSWRVKDARFQHNHHGVEILSDVCSNLQYS